MVRVNTKESAGIVVNVWPNNTDKDVADLNMELVIPASEETPWMVGQTVALEATWSPGSVSYVPNETMNRILESGSVQGPFLVTDMSPTDEGRLNITITSAGRISPLEQWSC